MPNPLDSTRVISGNFGQCFDADGNWLTNIMKVDATIEIGLDEVKRAGTRWIGHKVVSLKGSGSLGGYMVTSEFIEKMSQVADDLSSPYTTELLVVLDDPESFGAYRVRLRDVTFDKIPVINYEVGAIVEQELTFVFSGYTLIDSIRPV